VTILGTPLAIAPAANKRIIALANKMILLATSQRSPFLQSPNNMISSCNLILLSNMYANSLNY